jgi:hypothetical protein
MTYRKILAPLTGTARDAVVMATAIAAAAPYSGRIEALFVRPNPADAMPVYGEAVSGAIAQELVDSAREAGTQAAAAARKTFDQCVAESGAEAQFREIQGSFAQGVAQAARLCDLVAFGPLKDATKLGLVEAFETTLMNSGRPVLLRADTAPADFTARSAWRGTARPPACMRCCRPCRSCAARKASRCWWCSRRRTRNAPR